MAGSSNFRECKKIKDLKVPFLEGLLSREEESLMEKHLKTCRKCTVEMEQTSQWTDLLRGRSEIMCPEPWELFEAAQKPERVSPALKVHLERCQSCRAHMEAFSAPHTEQDMPNHIWAKIAEESERKVAAESRTTMWERLEIAMACIRDEFRVPAMALATAAAIVLLTLLVLPPMQTERVAQLGDAQWENVLIKRRLMSAKPGFPDATSMQRQRGAAVIFVQDGEAKSTSAWINDLYTKVEPTGDLLDRFKWVTPAEVKDGVVSKPAAKNDMDDMMQMLHDQLNVSVAVIVTLKPANGDNFIDVHATLVDTATGKSKARETAEVVKKSAVADHIRTMMQSLL